MSMETFTQVHRDVLRKPDLVLTPEMTARDVDTWDSMAHINLILAIETAFDVRLEMDVIANIRNVGDMVTHLNSQGHDIQWP
ncbi:MAG: acyl carrier protein [Magnetococcales bacterium]|nr:acyl carrier protein [Magnetococcales bacterium]